MTTRIAPLFGAALLSVAMPLHAQERSDLPPEAVVVEALDTHPAVAAAAARVQSAEAHGQMLRKGPHEITVQASAIRRSVEREGDYQEFDATVMRPFRLPGKAALDRQAGKLGIDVAHNRMEDVRHQTALNLSDLWHDWLTAGTLYRSDMRTVEGLEQALTAVKRRAELQDAAQLDVEQADAALALAETQAADSLAKREEARVTLAAHFPTIPLPPEPPELPEPALPPQGLDALRELVISRSHEIRAAEGEAQRLQTMSRRARADRIADPSFGVRLFSERTGMEQGAGVVASIPIGGGYRRAASDQASAEASAAELDLAETRRLVEAVASADVSNISSRKAAWESARRSAERTRAATQLSERGYQLGLIDLADLLQSRRLTNDAQRTEIDARSSLLRAILKIRIDSHSIWTASEDHLD